MGIYNRIEKDPTTMIEQLNIFFYQSTFWYKMQASKAQFLAITSKGPSDLSIYARKFKYLHIKLILLKSGG